MTWVLLGVSRCQDGLPGLLRSYELSRWWWPDRRWAGQARGSRLQAADWFAQGIAPPEVARRTMIPPGSWR